MKYSILLKSIPVLFLFLSCKTIDRIMVKKHDPITIIECTSQKWFGGIPGIKGEKYEIILVSKIDFTVDSLWIKGKACSLSAFHDNKVINNIVLNDTVVLRGSIRTQTNKMPVNEPENLPDSVNSIVPFGEKTIMSYLFKGEKYFLEIDSVTIKDPIFYP